MAGLKLASWLFILYVILRIASGEMNFFVAIFIGGILLLIVPPMIYRLILRKKVKSGELTDEDAFYKVSRIFGLENTSVAYMLSFDSWYFKRKRK